jgi:hypothetical protein
MTAAFPARPAGIVALPIGMMMVGMVAACTGEAPRERAQSESHMEGNVRVVVTSKAARDAAPVWSIVPDLRVGGGEEDEPTALGPVWDIVVRSDGQMALLMTRENRIRVFDARGNFVRFIGRTGSGPGEFRSPTKLVMDSLGHYWVSDNVRGVYIQFDSTGKLVAEYPRPPGFHCRPIACGLVLDDGRRLDGRFRAVAPSVFRAEWFIADRAGKITDSLALPLADSTPSTTVRAPEPFAKRLVYAPTPDGHMWFGFSTDYTLRKITLRGDTVVKISGSASPVPVSDADRAAFADRETDFARAVGVPKREGAAFPATKPPITQLIVAEDGDLWVALAGPVDGVVEWFDVYAPDGTLRARAHLKFRGAIFPQGAPAMNPAPIVVGREFVYMLTYDDNDVPTVVRAAIRRR